MKSLKAYSTREKFEEVKSHFKNPLNFLYILLSMALYSLFALFAMAIMFFIYLLLGPLFGIGLDSYSNFWPLLFFVVSVGATTYFVFLVFDNLLDPYFTGVSAKINLRIGLGLMLTGFAIVFLLFSSMLVLICIKSLEDKPKSKADKIIDLAHEMSDGGKLKDTALIKELVKDFKNIADNADLKWQQVDSEYGRFSVKFPNYDVMRKTATQKINGTEIEVSAVWVNSKDELDYNTFYGVNCFEYGNPTMVNSVFDLKKEHFLSDTKSKLDREVIIDSIGYPCREIHY